MMTFHTQYKMISEQTLNPSTRVEPPTAQLPTAHGSLPVISSPSPVEPCFSPYGHTHPVLFTPSPYSPQFHLPYVIYLSSRSIYYLPIEPAPTNPALLLCVTINLSPARTIPIS